MATVLRCVYHVANRGDDELRFLELYMVTTVGRDDILTAPGARDDCGKLLLMLSFHVRSVGTAFIRQTACDHDEWQVAERLRDVTALRTESGKLLMFDGIHSCENMPFAA